ncbi:MAG: C45 family peptidase [bacterium]|nr:C45 family peptidase [bacterium]
MFNSPLPLIKVHGSPFAMGKEIGIKARSLIRAGAQFYGKHWRALTGIPWSTARAALQASQKQARELVPKTFAELEGVAAGSGVSFELLFAINSAEAIERLKPREHCTTIIADRSITKSKKILFAHNEDWTWAERKWQYVISARPENEPAFLSFTYGAWLPQYGLNETGLTFAAESQTATDAQAGLSQTFMSREILRTPSINAALRRVRTLPRADGHTYVLADAKHGTILETTAKKSAAIALSKKEPLLVDTNFYQTKTCAEREREMRTYSRFRCYRVRELLLPALESITPDLLRQVLNDIQNAPESVLNQIAKFKKNELKEGTIATLIMDPAARSLEISLPEKRGRIFRFVLPR